MSIKNLIACLIIVSPSFSLTGCSHSSIPGPIKNIAKNELDRTLDQSIRMISDHLIEITLELYRLNPDELQKIKGMNLQARTTQIIEYSTAVAYKELNYMQGINAIKLVKSEDYRGDKVFALMLGISSMIETSYNNQKEFYFIDQIDPQKLYNSSANLELIANNLAQNKYQSFITINDLKEPYRIPMLLHRIAAIQKLVADLVSEKTGRLIDKAIGSMTVFLPI